MKFPKVWITVRVEGCEPLEYGIGGENQTGKLVLTAEVRQSADGVSVGATLTETIWTEKKGDTQ